MRVLIVTKLFPNGAEPESSPFNRQQFTELSRLCEVELWATIPWFPASKAVRRWSRAGRLLHVPRSERVDGLEVRHPRVAYVPKIASSLNGALYAASLSADALALHGKLDVVLGSWAYPDGCAAVWLAERLGVPAVVKVHGSDIDVLARRMGPRRRMQAVLPRADGIVAVSAALAARVAELGVAPERISVVKNGVDRTLFSPASRAEARRRLGLSPAAQNVLFVGRVERDKGVLELAAAVSRLADVELCVVGAGPAEAEVRSVGTQVRFVGPRPHREIALWLAATDVLALPSWHEGTPNVVLEALASGRPVVASRVGGIPDVVDRPLFGRLVPPRSPDSLAAALKGVLEEEHDAARIAHDAKIPSWGESARALYDTLLSALSERAREVA